MKENQHNEENFKRVKTFVFDVDGVLTDGTVLVLENGLQARRMSIRDGYALQLAVKRGYHIAVISGAAASPVVDRLKKLGISDVYMGVEDKKTLLDQYLLERNTDGSEVVYMGDDLPDYEVMSAVGLAVCPADAAPEIKEISAYITAARGGEGCVREIIEKVMKLRGDWIHTTAVSSR